MQPFSNLLSESDEDRKEGNGEGKERSFSVYRSSSVTRKGFCFHVTWSCKEGHSSVMPVQKRFSFKQTSFISRLALPSHIINPVEVDALCRCRCCFDGPEGIKR